MIKLFEYENYEVKVAPEALMLTPFRKLYSRDKNRDKHIAKQELAYVYFMSDPRSDYQYIVDTDIRSEEIIRGLGMPNGWKPDKHVKDAIVFYGSFKPASAGLLEDTRYFVSRFRETLKKISDELEGLEVKDLKEAMALMKQIPSLSKDLDEAERVLGKEIMADSKARGSQIKALLEDDD